MTNKNKKILVVEDTAAIAKAVVFALKEAGFEVELCLNGIEGLKKIKEGGHSLVLLDLIMPGKTGFEIMNELRMLGKSLPIIVYSSMPEAFTKTEALQLGAVDYFEKSQTSIMDLVEKVKKYSSL